MSILLSCLLTLTVVKAAPVTDSIQSEDQAMIHPGYQIPAGRNPQSGVIISKDSFSKANPVWSIQSFAGLNTTGVPVAEDVFPTSSRRKRYALQGQLLSKERWRVKNLTYTISKYPRAITKAETDRVMKEAFGVWAKVTPLTFTQKKSGSVHIEIRFERGEHGDGDPFDGPGGTLAHAFFPVYGGDAHFDDAEKWTVNSYRGTNLFQVAVYAFGHSLGLEDSNVKTSAMRPVFRGYEPSFELDRDDVEAIQELYGQGAEPFCGNTLDQMPKTEEFPEVVGESALCADATIDTILNSVEGDTYVFKDLHYWKLTETSIAQGYPRLISESWIGLPGNMDAAFTYKNGKTYFFKGSKYWRYTGKTMDGDYPKEISDGFQGIPSNINAAMVWGGNGKIYFFKGSKFWKFDPQQKPPVKSHYPKPISNWEGIPDNLDAALQYTNGYTYFFKGGNYYRFNDRAFMVAIVDPPFPRPTGEWWFGCKPDRL